MESLTDSNTPEQRSSGMRHTLIVSLAANLLIATAKVIYGHLTGSLAMYADGLHSFFDAGASLLGLAGIIIAVKPPDPSHPYGYERYESLSSLAIGGFIVLAILEIVSQAVNRLMSPELPQITWVSFTIIGASMFVSASVSWWERQRARKFSSELIAADALHTFSDVLVSGAVMVSLIGSFFGIRQLDPAIAMVVAVILAWAAFRVIQRATRVLTDAASVDLEQIVRAAKEVRGVEDCHAVRARGSPGHIRVDLHVLVDGNMTVFQAHDVTEAVTTTVRKIVPGIAEVFIHVGPTQKHNER
jgi:cation diffusion facilitator family transporter